MSQPHNPFWFDDFTDEVHTSIHYFQHHNNRFGFIIDVENEDLANFIASQIFEVRKCLIKNLETTFVYGSDGELCFYGHNCPHLIDLCRRELFATIRNIITNGNNICYYNQTFVLHTELCRTRFRELRNNNKENIPKH